MNKLNIILAILIVAAGGFFLYTLVSSRNIPLANTNVPSRPTSTAAAKNESSFDLKISDEGEVKIAVQPEISGNESEWNFRVAMNTHSMELMDDLTRVSALIGSGGAKYAPFAWEGDPPGGHHRGGILKFKAVSPLSSLITLTIRDVGGIKERKFEWQLKGQ